MAALFDIFALKIDKEKKQELLGQHFSLQKMTTNRSLENKVLKSMEFNRAAIQEEEEKESDELGVESDLEDDEED